MNLQYVGARYVPNFTGETWSQANEYEALTVVGFEGNSYISKKPVPAGTLIGNSEYWVLYAAGGGGGSDPRVPQIIADVQALQADVSDLETAVSGKADQSSLDTLSGRVAGVEADITSLATEVGKKQNQLVAGSNVTLTPLADGTVQISSSGGGGGGVVLQPTTGQSTTDGMTQKAITDELNSKATTTSLESLAGIVSGKADQSSVTALETLVAGKADQSSVTALETTVAGKADQSALNNSHAQFKHTFALNTFELVSSGDWLGYYKSDKTAVTVYNASGSVRACGSTIDAPATDAMKALVADMEFVASGTTLTAYAKTQPTEDVVVSVEGVA